MNKIEKEISLEALKAFGSKHQMKKAVEEMAELICEITRQEDGRSNDDKISEEVADVCILMDQIALIVGIENVERWKKFKLERLKEIINNRKHYEHRS